MVRQSLPGATAAGRPEVETMRRETPGQNSGVLNKNGKVGTLPTPDACHCWLRPPLPR